MTTLAAQHFPACKTIFVSESSYSISKVKVILTYWQFSKVQL
ncbi:UNVERIFIED_ORG: hypothetical protein ABIC97_000340 [Peribacillus simplex]